MPPSKLQLSPDQQLKRANLLSKFISKGRITALDVQRELGLTLEESNRVVEEMAMNLGQEVEIGVVLGR